MAKKKMSIDEIFKDYTEEELLSLDLDKVKSFTKMLIDLQLKKFKVKSLASASVYHDESNGLTFPKLIIQFSLNSLGLFVKLKPKWEGMSCIFRKMKELNMESWMSSTAALSAANKSLNDFYTACDLLTKDKNLPFAVSLVLFNKPIK